jgi:hypothetical protein
MLATDNNYNSLGRLGPHYGRSEYRPPVPQERAEAGPARPGDRRTLSVRNTEAPLKKAPPVIPAGRLNLGGAQELITAAAALIKDLPPWSTDREPHTNLRANLMTPVYA